VVKRLLQAISELTSARDLATVTGTTKAAALELTGADGVTVALRDHDQCFYADEHAVAPLWKGRRFPLDACISGWAMTHGEPVIVADIYADARIPHDFYRQTFVRSLVVVPIGAPDAIAAIGAYWAIEHRATSDELEALVALAEGTGLAITNTRLFDELRRSVARERDARLTAERAIAARDEFLTLVTHELRQPLHASLAALRLMRTRISRERGERARTVVERQIQQMNRLVEDLLDAARIVTSHVSMDLRTIDLRESVRCGIETIAPLMEERHHQFSVALPEGRVPVRADEARLQQVLMNLLTNAAKYTDTAGRIALTLTLADAHAVISLRDSGRGIEPDLLPRVFDLFTRGAGDITGFGIGLTVARRLVELQGGRLEAHSDGAGRGSEFVVYLPLDRLG
jgi:two-component system CheB/CheR fusion protein